MTEPIVIETPNETTTGTTTTPTAADATGNGGLAAALNRGLRKLADDKIKTFPVPGWDNMRLRARKPEEEARLGADTEEKTVAVCTDAILLDDGEGNWEEVQGGWPGVAALMGTPGVSQSQVIRKVLDNGSRLERFSRMLVAWLDGSAAEVERLLGE